MRLTQPVSLPASEVSHAYFRTGNQTDEVYGHPMTNDSAHESERRTRHRRIDPLLKAQGWTVVPFDPGCPLDRYEAYALTDQVEARFVKAKAQVDRLVPSLLAKAFRGGLVPTEAALARAEGRDYEPASALLKRIRTERASEGAAAGAGRSRTARRSSAGRRMGHVVKVSNPVTET